MTFGGRGGSLLSPVLIGKGPGEAGSQSQLTDDRGSNSTGSRAHTCAEVRTDLQVCGLCLEGKREKKLNP